jgi:hypothetical protein
MTFNHFKELYFDYAAKLPPKFANELTIMVSWDGYLQIQYGTEFIPIKDVKNEADRDWDSTFIDVIAWIIKHDAIT